MTDPAESSGVPGHPLVDQRESGRESARARWDAAAAAVLRKSGRLAEDAPDADAWARLARTTVEGLTIPPLGTACDARALPTAGALVSAPGIAPYLRGSVATGGWDVRTLIDGPDAANAVALADLSGGGNSLWIRIGAGGVPVDGLATALDGVYLDLAPVVLDGADDDILAAADVLGALAADLGTPLYPAGSLGADPLGQAVRGGTAADLSRIPALADRARELGIGALVVDGTAVHEAGAGDAQEVGYSLAAGAAYLRALTDAGLDIDTACALVGFRYAVTDEQFTSLAKLRAARFAWHRVTELCSASESARAQYQHAVTSRAMTTRYDRYVNMLRGTVAAFAAAAGGAQAITVLPFDAASGQSDEFSRRIARNVSVLLSGESDVDAVADPAGGAYAVEELTAALAEAAWAEFGRIEASGGIVAALADGSLSARIAETRTERNRRIAHRSWPITGVSEFPLASDAPAAPAAPSGADPDTETRPAHGTGPDDRTPAERDTGADAETKAPRRPATGAGWAEPFEALRDAPPPAGLALVRLGTQARSSARFSFAENLLIAGGVRVHAVNGPERADDKIPGSAPGGSTSSTPDQGLAAVIRATECTTAIIAGSDTDYASLLSEAVAAARTAGVRTVFLAGRPKALLAEWPDRMVDGTVAMGDDVLAFLHTVRAALGATDDPAPEEITRGGAR